MFGSMIRVLKAVSLAAGFVVAFASTSSANQFRVTEVALAPAMRSSSPKVDFSSMGISRSLLSPTALASRTFSLPFVTKNVSASSSHALSGVRAIARPDLIVRLQAPHVAFAGQDISPLMRLFARNIGAAAAPGTNGVINPAGGYMIDVVLSRDGNVPAGFAVFSPNFVEDVLLRGGGTSNTADLAPGRYENLSESGRDSSRHPNRELLSLCAHRSG